MTAALQEELTAKRQASLYPLLCGLNGSTLADKYEFIEPIAAGGQGVLYLGRTRDAEAKEVIIKLPLLAYDQPAQFGRKDIRRVRAILQREAERLRACQTFPFPTFYDLIIAPNPLQDQRRSDEITQQEPYLVMEPLWGESLDIFCCRYHDQPTETHLAALSQALAQLTANFAQAQTRLIESGYVYVDIKPSNFLVIEGWEGVRWLDPGSLYQEGDQEVFMSEPFKAPQVFMPQVLCLRTVEALSVRVWGRMLFTLWTGQRPPMQETLPLAQLVTPPQWLKELLHLANTPQPSTWQEVGSLVAGH